MVEGGRFFSPPPPVPLLPEEERRGMGMLRIPAIRHGRGRGDEKRGADEVSAPLWRVLVSRSHSTKRQVILLSS